MAHYRQIFFAVVPAEILHGVEQHVRSGPVQRRDVGRKGADMGAFIKIPGHVLGPGRVVLQTVVGRQQHRAVLGPQGIDVLQTNRRQIRQRPQKIYVHKRRGLYVFRKRSGGVCSPDRGRIGIKGGSFLRNLNPGEFPPHPLPGMLLRLPGKSEAERRKSQKNGQYSSMHGTFLSP